MTRSEDEARTKSPLELTAVDRDELQKMIDKIPPLELFEFDKKELQRLIDETQPAIEELQNWLAENRAQSIEELEKLIAESTAAAKKSAKMPDCLTLSDDI